MTPVWIMVMLCISPMLSCSEGDVWVTDMIFTSKDACYAEGAKRTGGRPQNNRIVICLEGKK